MTHFEIGHHKFYVNENKKGYETESVFSADTLQECLVEWKYRGYKEPEFFIDVWEEINGNPYPIADIKVEDWIFKTLEGNNV